MNALRHACLSSQGTSRGCENCHVGTAGYCDEFLVLMKQKCRFLDKEYFLSVQDREDIVGEFVLRVQSAADTFEGRKGAQFRIWANKIFHHARADFFRKSQRHESADDFPPTSESPEKSLEFRNML
ncbi:MAG: hypothetical protein B6245_17745 [Desulfobacteraceae bacterium 4572_88]|nr:MAG: hypothetical protein B6245_17745 [Desulfobacteraceae bacterium 4572_88]